MRSFLAWLLVAWCVGCGSSETTPSPLPLLNLGEECLVMPSQSDQTRNFCTILDSSGNPVAPTHANEVLGLFARIIPSGIRVRVVADPFEESSDGKPTNRFPELRNTLVILLEGDLAGARAYLKRSDLQPIRSSSR